MKFGVAALGALSLCAACADPQFQGERDAGRETVDAAVDSGADAGTNTPATPGRASKPTTGSLGTGGALRVGKTLQVADDGFEKQGRSCSKKHCAEGGLAP